MPVPGAVAEQAGPDTEEQAAGNVGGVAGGLHMQFHQTQRAQRKNADHADDDRREYLLKVKEPPRACSQ